MAHTINPWEAEASGIRRIQDMEGGMHPYPWRPEEGFLHRERQSQPWRDDLGRTFCIGDIRVSPGEMTWEGLSAQGTPESAPGRCSPVLPWE